MRWLHVGCPAPLTPKEKRRARRLGLPEIYAWKLAVGEAFRFSRIDRRMFLRRWRDELNHAEAVAGGEPMPATMWLPVWD